jgi:alkyldihydroxyacetonephosphate synthase
MRLWNGWGEEKTSYHLPPSAAAYLADRIGKSQPFPDASFEQAIGGAGPSQLKPHAGLLTDPTERFHHAHGQSLPDWVAIRSGRIAAFPDGVAYPASVEEVRGWLQYARQAGARLIPYGGGTSVAGHVNPRVQDAPTLTLDLSRLQRLLDLDETSQLATFEAGAAGPELERQLAAHGYTLGHFPQSWELSTLGGWIATRSSGQQSYHYGRIEDLFAGGSIETLAGTLALPPLPASAAGPDLRQMILGSEGRFGVITQGIMRVRKLPEVDQFHGVFFRDWEAGAEAVREIAQADLSVSMLRLSDAQETEATLHLSGKERLMAFANLGLNGLGYRAGRSLLILGVTGDRAATTFAYDAAAGVCRKHGGLMTGQTIGKAWRKGRFLNPYLRNTLWDLGYAVDTLETALPWSKVPAAATAIKDAIRGALEALNQRVFVFAHLSHVYGDGASIYVTYLWQRSADPDETLAQWKAMKSAASFAIIAHGGTITHQHGVGLDHAAYLKAEKGELGIRMIESIRQSLDPQRILNPGKLID